MSRARLWPRRAERTSPVSTINCSRAKSISSSGLGREDRLREVPRIDLALAGEGCERDPDQGHEGEHGQDQDQDDAAAPCRCERGG